MLSITVCFLGFIFVGRVITGSRKFDIIVSKKFEDSLFEMLRKSMLKSPAIYIFLFSAESLSFKGFMYSSIKRFSCMQGCLYIMPIILFLPFWFIDSMKYDSSSFDLCMLRSSLGL